MNGTQNEKGNFEVYLYVCVRARFFFFLSFLVLVETESALYVGHYLVYCTNLDW
jgi:hypothetical protein